MNEYFKYLDELRASGKTNMFGATAYLLEEFSELTNEEADKILIDWINSKNEKEKSI